MVNLAAGLALFAAPLGFSLSGADPYMLPKLWLLAAAAALMAWNAGRAGGLSALDRAVLVFLAAVAACSCRSIDVPTSLLGQYASQSFELLPCLILAALYFGASRAPSRSAAPHFLAAAGAVMALWGFSQAAGYDPVPFWPLPTGRITATMGSPLFAGALFALAFVAAVHLFLDGPLGRARLAAAAAAILISVGLYLTKSRGAWLAAGAAVPVYLALSGRLRIERRGAWLAAGGLAAALTLIMAGLWAGTKDEARLEIWRTAGEVFLEHPLTGSGPGTFGLEFRRRRSALFITMHSSSRAAQSHAHNEPLQVAATMGLLGLAAYAFLAWSFIAALAEAGQASERALVGAAAAAYFVQAQVNPTPPAAMAVLAVLAGRLRSARAPMVYTSLDRPAWVQRVAAAGAFAVVSLMSAADSAYLEGLVLEAHRQDPAVAFHQAALLNPLEMAHWSKMVSSLNGMAVSAPSPEIRRLVADRSRQLSGWGLRMHPRHPEAWELAARSEVLAMVAYEDMAAFESAKARLARSEELAPLFRPAVAQRLKLCKLAKDGAGVRRAEAELEQIRRLEAM